MYNKYYGFQESPFNLTPNSRFFFPSGKHTDALDSLVYAIRERKGFIVITGEIGSGKTTVCRTLLNQLDTKTQTALVTNTHLNGKDLLMSVLDEFEIDYTSTSKIRLLARLNEYLIEQLRRDHNVVLIIDEAQNLKPSVLEDIRMLSNLETETDKLIQIILLGQPELKKKLSLDRLEQLRQRIAIFYHLSPLSLEETREYILHRLKVARGSNRQYLAESCFPLIYKFSKGVPRLINQICDSAFLTGYVKELYTIDENVIKEVIQESPIQQLAMDFRKIKKEEGVNFKNTQLGVCNFPADSIEVDEVL